MTSVDFQLPKTSSGAAAKLASSHSSEQSIKLYGAWFCPYVQRVWITLCEKAIAYQYVEINPHHKDSAFLALNPRGLVPTLVMAQDDGEAKVLFESSILCEYLDDAFSHPPSLLPSEAYAKARARLWIDHVNSRIVPAFYKLMQHTPDKAYSLDEARAELRRQIESLVEQMDPDGPWFLGRHISLVDISLIPWARRLWLVDACKPGGGVALPVDGELWTRWALWREAVDGRQSVGDTTSDDESYLAAYKWFMRDKTASEVGQATRRGQRSS
ncbi:hypothetical protein XA68_16478 [Ophiocordyceps unilateralis]|uniref:GST N-terminal domain-containing protein n=1 Tax=Ophiocordyceps unilateralis TaxID=268505 RepID=A0A2A9P6J2_OPHUN|nr:hypothetical protein XA68_16478 [Ophiocordyceps unilateralis]